MGKTTDFILNKSSKITETYSIIAIVILIMYLLANFSLYNSAVKFADKYDADIVIEYDAEPDYKTAFPAGEDKPIVIIQYSPSYLKFYQDG